MKALDVIEDRSTRGGGAELRFQNMIFPFAIKLVLHACRNWMAEMRWGGTGGNMRHTIFAVFMTAGLSLVGMAGASAAPAAGQALSNTAARSDLVIHVSGDCGPHRHRDRHGHCVHD
jgi:hypothetical protein